MKESAKLPASNLEGMTSSLALKAAKKELRTLMKQKLSILSIDSVNAQSAAVFRSLKGLKAYQDSIRICVYLSMPSGEVQTDAIVRDALQSGKQVFVPYLHKSAAPSPDEPRSVMDMVDLRSLSDYESLERDSWGIPTIPAATVGDREHILENPTGATGSLDMILMPGVAFDLDPKTSFVRRLGHGKGFYDYFLHRYMQDRGSLYSNTLSSSPGTDILLYGLALKEQLLKSETGSWVPVGEYDSLLHGLVVGDGNILEGPLEE